MQIQISHKVASKASVDSKLGPAVYVSKEDLTSVEYGHDQLIITLNLKKDEVANLQSIDVTKIGKDKIALSRLFLKNGYRAALYDLETFNGKVQALAIFDKTCLKITRIRPSTLWRCKCFSASR